MNLNLRAEYNNIQIKAGEEWETAFRICYGLYEILVMPFGLMNAPAMFQRLINNLLYKYLNIFIIAYLNDILIYSKIKSKYIKYIKKVLGKLKAAELLIQSEKCEFHKKEVKFLGSIINIIGMRINPEKIRAVEEWPIPTNITEIQSFLSFANFYKCFI